MAKNKMSKAGILLGVADMAKARNFYETVLEQKVELESGGVYVVYESGVYLQQGFADLLEGKLFSKPTGAKLNPMKKSDNCQIGFEVEDLDYWVTKIKAVGDIELVHDVVEFDWGQRVIRFYDYDGHIVEIGESNVAFVRRLAKEGYSVEELAKRTWDTVENVQQFLKSE